MTAGIDAAQPLLFLRFRLAVHVPAARATRQMAGLRRSRFTPVVAERTCIDHWGQPACVRRLRRSAPSRTAHALFRAEQLGIPCKMPPAHPSRPDEAAAARHCRAGATCVRARNLPLHLARRPRSLDRPRRSPNCASASGMPDGPGTHQERGSARRSCGAIRRTCNRRSACYGVPTFV